MLWHINISLIRYNIRDPFEKVSPFALNTELIFFLFEFSDL